MEQIPELRNENVNKVERLRDVICIDIIIAIGNLASEILESLI